MKRTLLVFLLVSLIVSACAPVSAPTPTPAPSATPLPTATLLPTATPTPVPTATPTPIPTIQVGDLSVPDPRVTNPELFDLHNPDAPIPQFVSAMNEIGVDVNPEDVVNGLAANYETRQGPDGKTYVLTTYTAEGKNGAHYSMGLIAEQDGRGKWRWKELTPRILDEYNTDTDFGIVITGYDYNYQFFEEIGSVIFDQSLTRTWIEKNGRRSINFIVNLVTRNRQILYEHPGFWHLDIDSQLRSLQSREEVLEYMRNLANDYMTTAKETHSRTGRPVLINFANEPWWADPPNNPINVGWLESPYYRYLGKDYLVEGYLAFYNAGIEKGLRPGEDFRLILSVDGIFFPNPKLDLAINTINTMKRKISERLGIPVEDVQIDLALQWRFDPTVTGGKMSNEGRYRMPTENELITALRKIRKAGIPFHITEFEIANLTNDEFALYLQKFTKIALDYKPLSIQYGGLIATPGNPYTDMNHPVREIYDNGIRTSTYYAYLDSLLRSAALSETP